MQGVQAVIRLGLPTAIINVTRDLVVCTFVDGSRAECDITNSHGPNARENARFWGYEDHVRYYQHHDLIHCWLWDRIHGKPSPTLWAVAHDLPPPPENRDEEQLVNHVQFALAQDRADEFSRFFANEIGPDWRYILNDLAELLERIGLPLPALEMQP